MRIRTQKIRTTKIMTKTTRQMQSPKSHQIRTFSPPNTNQTPKNHYNHNKISKIFRKKHQKSSPTVNLHKNLLIPTIHSTKLK